MAAARWYKLSTDQGYAKAQFNLALFYKGGLGVTQNLQTAKH
jgi:TPR repeat protein